MSFESSPGVFRSGGVTIACLNWGATIPVKREALTITVSMKQALQDTVLVMEVGIGSGMQLFVGDLKMSSRVGFSVSGSN